MSATTLHGLTAVKIGATVLGGITRRSLRTASDVRAEATSGELYARFGALYAQNPVAEFGTLNIAAALSACGLVGSALTSAAPLILYAQKQQEGGGRASGSVHNSYTLNEGLLYPRRLSCEHQGDASIDYDALVTWDGTNDPIVLTENAAMPTPVTDAERFTLGPITLTDDSDGEFTLSQKLRVEIDFGQQAEAMGADSDLWPTFARMGSISPGITLTGLDMAWFKSTVIPLIGRSIKHSGTSIVFRKRKRHETFHTSAETEHIVATVAGMAVVEQVLDASGNNVDQNSVRIPLTYDGTNVPIVLTTGQAYT